MTICLHRSLDIDDILWLVEVEYFMITSNGTLIVDTASIKNQHYEKGKDYEFIGVTQ